MNIYNASIVIVIILLVVLTNFLYEHLNYKIKIFKLLRKLKTLAGNFIKKIDYFDIFGLREIDWLFDNLKKRDGIITKKEAEIDEWMAEWHTALDAAKNSNNYYEEKTEKLKEDINSVCITVNILRGELSKSKSDFKHSNLKLNNMEKILDDKIEVIKVFNKNSIRDHNQILEMEQVIESLEIELKKSQKEYFGIFDTNRDNINTIHGLFMNIENTISNHKSDLIGYGEDE